MPRSQRSAVSRRSAPGLQEAAINNIVRRHFVRIHVPSARPSIKSVGPTSKFFKKKKKLNKKLLSLRVCTDIYGYGWMKFNTHETWWTVLPVAHPGFFFGLWCGGQIHFPTKTSFTSTLNAIKNFQVFGSRVLTTRFKNPEYRTGNTLIFSLRFHVLFIFFFFSFSADRPESDIRWGIGFQLWRRCHLSPVFQINPHATVAKKLLRLLNNAAKGKEKEKREIKHL